MWKGGETTIETKAIIFVLGGGYDIVLIGWIGVNTIWGIKGVVGGSRYHTGIPKVKLGRLRVAMMGLLTISDCGKRKVIVWIGNEPQ